jgi:hypothetical protein
MARKVTYDQEKVKLLRGALIEDSIAVFNGDASVETWSDYRKVLLQKYAPYVLPRLNAGKDDDTDLQVTPLLVKFIGDETDGDSNGV